MSTKNHLATAKPTGRQKHISAADLKQIAFLVECRRMNYTEACAFLDIPYPTWRNFIQRSGSAPKWDDMVARVKAAYLEGRLANIQDAETGKNGHRPDWRASKALLEFAAPERYLPQLPPQDAGRQPAVATTTISVMVQSVYGLHTATMNWNSFSQVTFAFAVTPELLAQGIVWAVLIGLIGGLFPALRGARLPIAAALREL